jgi:hypothetical protein
MDGLDNVSVTPNPVPEPSSVMLIGRAGIFALSRPFFRKKPNDSVTQEKLNSLK